MRYLIFVLYIPPPVRLLIFVAAAFIVVAGAIAAIYTAFSRPCK
jgi:hypothetical protein